MTETDIEALLDVIVDAIGDYEKHSGMWYSFNCPHCAEENDGVVDGKSNCEVNIDEQYYHCWKCKKSGRISSLIKQFGSVQQHNTYVSILKSIHRENSSTQKSIANDIEVLLPNTFKLLSEAKSNSAEEPLEYLYDRGITDSIITKYNIGYVVGCDDFKFNNRIIVPSYDSYNCLNYFVGRDYTGLQKLKYMNPKVKKTQFIFNEALVSWYEPIVLVEGVFDHIVVPNSIPLLGKSLSDDSLLYNTLIEKAKDKVYIFLDNDAKDDAIELYKKLYSTQALKDKVRLIDTPTGYDPSDLYRDFGKNGILDLLKNPIQLHEVDFLLF